MSSEKLIEIKDLHTHFYTEAGTAKAVDGVSYILMIHMKRLYLKKTSNLQILMEMESGILQKISLMKMEME